MNVPGGSQDVTRTCGARRLVTLLVALVALVATVQPAEAAGHSPATDPFYSYSGSTSLEDVAPGAVLKTRTISYHLLGLPLPVRAVQLLHRATNQRGEATVNVTTVVRPLLGSTAHRVVSYQSFYDSLNPADEPSSIIAGGLTFGGAIATAETALIVPFLLAGDAVVVTDTEGQTADFASGPEYGTNTLDGIRAALAAPQAHIADDAKVAMIGYSGGAIATEWAAELAPSYAPDVDRRLVGAAMGGVLVNPARNLHYVDGSLVWSGVMPMALVGLARAFDVDLTPYLSDKGRQLNTELQDATIAQVLGTHPGLTFADLTKPAYEDPESIPEFVRIANQLIMGRQGTPTIPLFIGQGTGGELEGTSGSKPGIGKGDGVMVAGDVRTLARTYCDRGVSVTYRQYPLSHITTAALWAPEAISWVLARFGSRPASHAVGTGEGMASARICRS